jgi:hypothetical protein
MRTLIMVLGIAMSLTANASKDANCKNAPKMGLFTSTKAGNTVASASTQTKCSGFGCGKKATN